ncbi:4-phosphoerythronate dehydrogenase [Klebsiella pneumoniae subsp. rhinoscleromatis ATCC 13884]|uniref:D-3-phosphoglycerate dehydrogenase n=1 Tax=Klebsiella pneumoniae TaxID=573 RepID=A0A377XNI5_KLEPN|nr:glyoxylate/hydroxypyruvate reductase A [Klebsiella pneumoniae]STV62966.1 D-3-phosphoglycerate dehydrogenase [Klebsiella pneumoniae subsp. rhinoscleromatis]EEW39922.1 4-phosphoerythronate dehydrogenase [Klebsiella pneumoniae subsp. rhinoscleromatis ATCC 13884]STT65264.1 D-3-phosphoglycerate dehydrogenase [Klebsiella pneumoniae]STT84430.1 D-3-phosphoglycerate dehydrogenase [Klebsiella pneumoniae]STU08498.1 D-3-phosphoglycerate dehydrogenase [Klebsiella pneumoniae]
MSDITIVVDCNDADFARDICAALQQFPDVTALLPHHQAARDAQYASCWFPDPQLLTRSPGLKLIQAASAGVDHLPPALFASEIPLCRVIDEDFRHGMFEYALWSVLWFQRHFDRALAHQRTQTWKLYPQRAAADFHIGIMGLGEIGGYIADQLARLGYRVSGWSRSEKQLAGVTCYRGEEALDSFLGSLDGLINLLPLTAQTRGILAAPLFSRLPAGAVLDVFPQEPLPADDPLWRHPQVVITPHMASAASAEVIARQLLENIQRQRRGLPLKNLVNKHAGY